MLRWRKMPLRPGKLADYPLENAQYAVQLGVIQDGWVGDGAVALSHQSRQLVVVEMAEPGFAGFNAQAESILVE